MAVAEKVLKAGIKRIGDLMYYVKNGDVWAVPRTKPGKPKGRAILVVRAGVKMDYSKYLYFIDADGDVARKARDAGGSKRERGALANTAAPAKKAVPAKRTAPAVLPVTKEVVERAPSRHEALVLVDGGPAVEPTRFPAIKKMKPASLLALRQPIKAGLRPEASAGVRARRSKISNAVGDRAEEAVLAHLRSSLSPAEAQTLRWVAQAGETPGWDLEYVRGDRVLVRVEVKGTTASRFPSFELTANEWAAAEEHRGEYWVYLVADCGNSTPRFQALQDPFGLMLAGKMTATTSVWLITATASL